MLKEYDRPLHVGEVSHIRSSQGCPPPARDRFPAVVNKFMRACPALISAHSASCSAPALHLVRVSARAQLSAATAAASPSVERAPQSFGTASLRKPAPQRARAASTSARTRGERRETCG